MVWIVGFGLWLGASVFLGIRLGRFMKAPDDDPHRITNSDSFLPAVRSSLSAEDCRSAVVQPHGAPAPVERPAARAAGDLAKLFGCFDAGRPFTVRGGRDD